MTISITPNKLIELTSMFAYVAKPGSKLSFKQLESFMGFWEFCLECLPVCMKSFTHYTHKWKNRFNLVIKAKHSGKSLQQFAPRKVKKDAQIMLAVLPHCNGTQPLQPMRDLPWQRPLMTDASSTAGGYVCAHLAYARKFTARERKAIIAVKEAKMVHEAIEHCASEWQHSVVPIYVDNTVCLYSFTKGRSKNTRINDLVRATLATCASHHIIPVFYYVPSASNLLADNLSRGHLQAYRDALTWFVCPDGMLLEAPREAFHLSEASESSIAKYVDMSTADSSRKTYQSGWNAWLQHCAEETMDPLGTVMIGPFLLDYLNSKLSTLHEYTYINTLLVYLYYPLH
jgi:hypothetical protein